LARQTVTFANQTEIIFNSALGNESKLKTVMERMKRFLKKSGQILEASKTEYDSAMTKMENFLPKFKDFERNMGTLTDYNSERCYHGTTLATMMVFGCTSWHYNMVAMKKKSEKLVTRFGGLEDGLKEAIAFLEEEIYIINEWDALVDNAEANIAMIPSNLLADVPQLFTDDLKEMKRVAKEFLRRPINLFGTDSPQADQNCRDDCVTQ